MRAYKCWCVYRYLSCVCSGCTVCCVYHGWPQAETESETNEANCTTKKKREFQQHSRLKQTSLKCVVVSVSHLSTRRSSFDTFHCDFWSWNCKFVLFVKRSLCVCVVHLYLSLIKTKQNKNIGNLLIICCLIVVYALDLSLYFRSIRVKIDVLIRFYFNEHFWQSMAFLFSFEFYIKSFCFFCVNYLFE